MGRLIFCAGGLFVLALIAGCGDGKGSVRGTVSLDGQTVKSGSITFVSTEGELIREGAVITNGAFTARMPPGKYKLELTGSRPAGTRTQKGFDGKDEVIELTEELFPDYFNSKSDLTEVIKPGDNTVNLDLKTKE
jgi:hypothetical protein